MLYISTKYPGADVLQFKSGSQEVQFIGQETRQSAEFSQVAQPSLHPNKILFLIIRILKRIIFTLDHSS